MTIAINVWGIYGTSLAKTSKIVTHSSMWYLVGSTVLLLQGVLVGPLPTWRKLEYQLKKCYQFSLQAGLWRIFLTAVGGTTPGEEVPSGIRKQDEQAFLHGLYFSSCPIPA